MQIASQQGTREDMAMTEEEVVVVVGASQGGEAVEAMVEEAGAMVGVEADEVSPQALVSSCQSCAVVFLRLGK